MYSSMKHCIHLLTCPVCGSTLSQSGNTLQCASGHSFDFAREGYVNFLRKKLPGDTKEMLLARRNFLERGYYAPLSDAINGLVYQYLSSSGIHEAALLDAGCGEGYYLGRLQQSLTARLAHITWNFLGLDISKEAIKMAARKYRECCFMVASINETLMIADSSIHVLLNTFAPRNAREYARIVAPGGMFLVVIPGPQHLLSLRSTLHLLTIEEQKQQRVIDQFSDAFTLQETITLDYELTLKQEELVQLITMTPNARHMQQQTWDAISSIEQIQTQVEFICLVFFRKER